MLAVSATGVEVGRGIGAVARATLANEYTIAKSTGYVFPGGLQDKFAGAPACYGLCLGGLVQGDGNLERGGQRVMSRETPNPARPVRPPRRQPRLEHFVMGGAVLA